MSWCERSFYDILILWWYWEIRSRSSRPQKCWLYNVSWFCNKWWLCIGWGCCAIHLVACILVESVAKYLMWLCNTWCFRSTQYLMVWYATHIKTFMYKLAYWFSRSSGYTYWWLDLYISKAHVQVWWPQDHRCLCYILCRFSHYDCSPWSHIHLISHTISHVNKVIWV